MAINLNNYIWNKEQVKEDPKYLELPPGGYVCKIFDARTEEIEGKGLRLTCDVDIAEGEFKNFFLSKSKRRGKWDFNAQFVRYIIRDGEFTDAFENFIKTITKDNPNFTFDRDNFEADDLRALKCGFTFGEREYRDKLGFIRTSAKICFPQSIERIKKGLFKIPPIQKLPENANPSKEAGEVLSDAEKEILNDSTSVPDDFPF